MPDPSRCLRVVRRGPDVWRVYEYLPGTMTASTVSLVFECDAAMRRVREFPPNWHELSDDELLDLSWRR